MTDAADVERTLEAARLAVLKARACWAEWVAPPPDFEVNLSDEEYAKRREVELAAGQAEHALRDALKVIREQFLGRPPAEAHEGDWLPAGAYDGGSDEPGGGTGADPERPETWAFAEPAAAEGAGRDTAVPGMRPLATLIAGAAAQECTYCHAGLGVPCVTGPDGYHLARFLGVLHDRAAARLVGAAATPHGDMSGIVRDTSPEVTP